MGDPGVNEILGLEELEEAVGRLHTGRKHTLSLLVENKPGVLTRVAGLFSRRAVNIETLAVGPTNDPEVSRMTITLDGAEHPIDQVVKQVDKLVNVLKITDLDPSTTVVRELALYKVSAKGSKRNEVAQLATTFRGKVVDIQEGSITVEVTGSDDKIEAFESLVKPYGLLEMMRTGEIGISRSEDQT